MGFIKKSVGNEQSFGKDLIELRQLRGWSKSQLSSVSGIPEYIIKALETEDFSAFDNPAYQERHVKTLVNALDGRPPFFVGKYRAALARDGYNPGGNIKDYSFIHKIKKTEFFTTTKYLPFLLLIPVFVLLGLYVWNEAKIFREAPILKLDSPGNNSIINDPRVIIKGRTDPNAELTVNGQNAVVEQDGNFSITLNIPRGLTKLTIVAKRRYGLENSQIRYVTYNPVLGPAPPDDTIKYYENYSAQSTVFTTSTTSTN